MYIYHSCAYRVLTNPLTNKCGRYVCWKVENLWFVQYYRTDIPLTLTVFDNDAEFERYYQKLKNNYKNEKFEENIPVPDVKYPEYGAQLLPF